MIGLRRRNKPFGSGPLHPGRKSFNLVKCPGLDDFFFEQVADDRRHPMIPEAARVDGCRYEIVSQGVHGQKGSGHGRIPEIVGKRTTGHGWARGGLCRDNRDILAVDLVPHIRETDPRKVAAPTGAPHNHIGIDADFLQLLLGFQSHNRLMQEHMIQNAPQRIARLLIGNSIFNGLANGYTQASRGIGIFSQYLFSCLSKVAGAGNTVGTPGHHHHPAVRLLFIAHPHHEYPAFKIEHLTRHAQRASPLAGTGLSGQPFYAKHFVVIGLRHRSVGLVRPRRAHPFILVVDLHRGIQQFLQISRPV